MDVPYSTAGMPAVAVFVDRAAVPWLRPLRPGFRHCFGAVRQQDGVWIVCDPLKHRLEIAAVRPDDELDLVRRWHEAGHRICVGRAIAPPRTRAPVPGPLTCVAVVKRLLGVRAPGVLTPYQLHRHLLSRPADRFVAW